MCTRINEIGGEAHPYTTKVESVARNQGLINYISTALIAFKCSSIEKRLDDGHKPSS